MAYSQAVVLAGGIAHVPVLITFLKFLDSKTLKIHNQKAEFVAQEEQAASRAAAAEKLAREQAAAKAKSAAEAQSSSNEPPKQPSEN